MKEVKSIFDVIGPIMIGPSSSHTAGAARLGKIARYSAHKDIKKVKVFLYGSFAETGEGHGTKKAIAAGLLGMEPHDERLRDSLKLIKKENIEIKFINKDIQTSHPNTAKFAIEKSDGSTISLTGSSIGGGAVVVNNINGFEVEITGEYYTIITKHRDVKGTIGRITTFLAKENINIANMKVIRDRNKKEASMIIETDQVVEEKAVNEIKEMDNMIDVVIIRPVKENKNV